MRSWIARASMCLSCAQWSIETHFHEGSKRNNLAARRRTYADHLDYFVVGVWFWWLSAGTGTRILRRRRDQPDYLNCDHSVAVEGHLNGRPEWAPSLGARRCVYKQNGDLPHVAVRVPPPRNQTSKLAKTTVGAKVTGSTGVLGKISGNHLVITAPMCFLS